MIYDAGANSYEMYDVELDPGETADIFETASGERAEWADHLQSIGAILVDLNTAEGASKLDEETRASLRALGYLDR